MSTTIDERVVELRFDNEDFETNVQISLSTLDKLRESLNFDSSSKSLEKVGDAAKKIDLSGLSSGIQNVRAQFSALDVIGTTVIANLANSVVNAGKSFVKTVTSSVIQGGITRAKNLEQANFMLKGLLKDDEKVADVMQNVSDAVDGTAYSLDEAALVASQLVASGEVAGEKMESRLRAVAGVAAMTGSSYSDIGNIFTTVAGNGRLMGEQLLQLSSRGINAAAALADYLHVTESEVREMTTKGEISFGQFARAMDRAFGEHAKSANETFVGALSNMKAALSRIGAEVATPALQRLRPVVLSLKDAFDAAHLALMPFINHINWLIRLLSKDAKNVIDKFTNAMTEMKKVDGEEMRVLTETGTKLTTVAKGFFALLDSIRIIIKTIFKMALTAISPITKRFGKFGDKLLDVNVSLAETIISFRNWLRENNHAVEFVQKLVNKVGEFVAKAKAMILSNKSLASTLIKVRNAARDAVVGIIKYVKSIDWLNVVLKVFNKIKTIATKIYSVIKPYVSIIKDAFVNLFDDIRSLDKITLAGIIGAFKNFGSTIKNAFSGEWTKTLSSVVDVFEDIIRAMFDFTGFVAYADTEGSSSSESLSSSMKSNFGSAGDAVLKLWDILKSFVSYVKTNFLSRIGLGELMTIGLGVSMIYGLKKFSDGVLSAIGVLDEALSVVKPFTSIVSHLNGLIDKFAEALVNKMNAEALQARAGAIWLIAKAIAMLAASVIALAMVDQDKLARGVTAVIGLAGALAIIAFASSKLMMTSKASIGGVAAIIALAGACYILVKALNNLEKFNFENSLDGFIALLGIMVVTFAMMAAFGKLENKGFSKAAALNMVAMAGSVYLIAVALEKLQFIDLSGMQTTIGVIAEILAMFAILTMLPSSKSGLGTVIGIIGFVAALYLLSKTLVMIAKIDFSIIISNIGKYIVIFGILVGLIAVTKLAGQYAARAGVALIAIAVALYLFVGVIKLLSKMDESDLSKGLAAVSQLLLIFVAVIAATKLAGKYSIRAGVSLLLMAAAIGVLSLCIVALSHIKPKGLKNAVAAISILELCFAVLIAATSKMSDSKGLQKNLITMGVVIALLVVSLGALSMIKPKKLLSSATALTSVMLALSVVMAAASKTGDGAKKALPKMAIVISVLGSITACLYLLAQTKPKNALASAIALSGTLLAFSAALKIISSVSFKKVGSKMLANIGILVAVAYLLGGLLAALSQITDPKSVIPVATALSETLLAFSVVVAILGKFGKGSLAGSAEGALAMVTVASIITAFIGVLGGIVYWIEKAGVDLEYFINKGASLLCAVGEALGDVVGAFAKGFIEKSSESLPTLGKNLTEFMDEAQPFIEAVSGIDEGPTKGIQNLVDCITKLSSANLKDAMAKFITGDDLGTFGVKLVLLGQGINEYVDSVADLTDDDIAQIEKSTAALYALADVQNALSATGGLFQMVFGSHNLGNFGWSLSALGMGLCAYADSISELKNGDIAHIVLSAQALAALAEVQKSMTLANGLFQAFAGQKDISAFGARLAPLGKGLADYAKSIEDIGIGDGIIQKIKWSAQGLLALVDVQKALENSGGLAQFFAGGGNVGNFGKRLSKLGKGLADYAESLSGISGDTIAKITTSADALKAMVGVGNAINDMDTISWITVASFNANIPSLGKALSNYSNNLGELNATRVKTSADAILSLAKSLTKIKALGNIDTSSFVKAAQSLPKALNSNVSESDLDVSSKYSAAVSSAVKAVSGMADSMKSAGSSVAAAFVSGVSSKKAKTGAHDAGVSLAKRAKSGVVDGKKGIKGLGGDFADGYVSGIASKEKLSAAYSAGFKLASRAKQGTKDGQDSDSPSKEARKLGNYYGQGYVLGIQSYNSVVENVAGRLAETGLTTMSETLSKISDIVSSEMVDQVNPTITPIIDLSDVQNGISDINTILTNTKALSLQADFANGIVTPDVVNQQSLVDAIQNAIFTSANTRDAANSDIISALDKLSDNMSRGDTYNINGITYDDGSNITTAVETLVRATKIEGRV